MSARENSRTQQQVEHLTAIELAETYGFERSQVAWSCPLPAQQAKAADHHSNRHLS